MIHEFNDDCDCYSNSCVVAKTNDIVREKKEIGVDFYTRVKQRNEIKNQMHNTFQNYF